MTWVASLGSAAAAGVAGAAEMSSVAARAAETSARAPGIVHRKVLLSTNAPAGVGGGGEATPNPRGVGQAQIEGGIRCWWFGHPRLGR